MVQTINIVISFIALTFLFALLYRILPRKKLTWSDVFVGGGLTSLLFVLGNTILSIYLSHINLASTYGAAGSLVSILIWLYYSGQIFFFGAEFTYIRALNYGSLSRTK
jgi:membrane protein